MFLLPFAKIISFWSYFCAAETLPLRRSQSNEVTEERNVQVVAEASSPEQNKSPNNQFLSGQIGFEESPVPSKCFFFFLFWNTNHSVSLRQLENPLSCWWFLEMFLLSFAKIFSFWNYFCAAETLPLRRSQSNEVTEERNVQVVAEASSPEQNKLPNDEFLSGRLVSRKIAYQVSVFLFYFLLSCSMEVLSCCKKSNLRQGQIMILHPSKRKKK